MPRLPRIGEPISARHLSDVVRLAERGRVGSAPGTRTTSGPLGTTVRSAPRPGLIASTATATRHPFQIYGPYLDGSDWKIGITPGTLNGLTPVVGDVSGSGGSTLTSASRLTLATGEPYVVLGVLTDLETREITRLTVQTVEDTTPTTDTGARTRTTYIPLAELLEDTGPTWSLLTQIATTHLKYFTAGSADFTWRA